jgi:hypothetical protein
MKDFPTRYPGRSVVGVLLLLALFVTFASSTECDVAFCYNSAGVEIQHRDGRQQPMCDSCFNGTVWDRGMRETGSPGNGVIVRDL